MFIAPHLVEYAKGQSALINASPMAAYFASAEAMAGTLAPARGAARAGVEAVGFASRRTLATIDTMSRLSRCRTPKDFVDEQNRFWSLAMEQYLDASHKMLQAFTQNALPKPDVRPAIEAQAAEPARPAASRTHDIILLPETKSSSSRATRTETQDREAA